MRQRPCPCCCLVAGGRGAHNEYTANKCLTTCLGRRSPGKKGPWGGTPTTYFRLLAVTSFKPRDAVPGRRCPRAEEGAEAPGVQEGLRPEGRWWGPSSEALFWEEWPPGSLPSLPRGPQGRLCQAQGAGEGVLAEGPALLRAWVCPAAPSRKPW